MGGKKASYLTASVYYIIGNIIGQGIILLSSGIFTRIMGEAEYGLVSTYGAWVLVINTFIGLNLFITVRNAYIDYRQDYKRFQSSVLLLSLISFLILSIVILTFIKILGINVEIGIVVLALIQGSANHTINYLSAVLSMENRYISRTFLMVVPNFLHTVLSIVFILLLPHYKYFAKVLGNSLGMAIVAITIIIYIFIQAKPQIIPGYWKYSTKISLPAVANTLSDLILMQSDRIMITWLVGEAETAVYSLVYNIASILIAIYTAVGGAWTPWFYKKLEEKKYVIIQWVMKWYIFIFCFLTIGLMYISPEIIKILSPKSYWSGISYVNLITIASFLIYLYTFFTTYLMYLKKTQVIAFNTVIAAGINVILNYILIPKYYARGASCATVISYSLLFILHYCAIVKGGKNIFPKRIFVEGLGCIIIAGIIFKWIYPYMLLRFFVILIMIIGVAVVLFKNRDLLIERVKGDM